MRFEQEQNLLLLRLRLRRPAAAAAGIHFRKSQRRRAALVFASRIGTAVDERLHGGGTTGPHGLVQRSRSALIGCIRIGAGRDQTGDGLCLRMRVPGGRPRHPGRRGVKRLRTTPIPRPHVGAGTDEPIYEIGAVAGRRDVQGGIARINVSSDFGEEIRLRRRSRSAGLEACSHVSGDTASNRAAASASPSTIARTSFMSSESDVWDTITTASSRKLMQVRELSENPSTATRSSHRAADAISSDPARRRFPRPASRSNTLAIG
jgi:hypothetical protein